MTLNWRRLLSGAVMLLAIQSAGRADTITFGNLSIDHLASTGTHTEGAFTYEATLGAGWEIQDIFGNPASALVDFFNGEGAAVGNTFQITRTGGGAFNFISVDYRTIANDEVFAADTAQITGSLGGNPVGTLNLNVDSVVFQTYASGFSGPIDLLQVKVTSIGSFAFIMDNFVLTTAEAVPSPAASVLGLAGFGLLALRRARRD